MQFIEDATESLNSKNPAEKTEVAIVCVEFQYTYHLLTAAVLQFLARFLGKCAPGSIAKPLIKPLIALLIDKLSDSMGPVRDSATQTLAAIMRVRLIRGSHFVMTD